MGYIGDHDQVCEKQMNLRIPNFRIRAVACCLIFSLMPAVIFYVILFFPVPKGGLFFSIFAHSPYALWGAVRTTLILFVFPCFVFTHRANFLLPYATLTLFSLPFGIGTAYLQHLGWKSFICAEAWAWIVFAGVWWLFLDFPYHRIWKSYFPWTFFVSFFPLYLYFLYYEIWNYHLAWLLWISPYGAGYFMDWSLMVTPFFIVMYKFVLRFSEFLNWNHS